MKTTASCLAAGIVGLLCGCGTNSNPCVLGNSFGIASSTPANTANHASTPPANQVRLFASSGPYVVSGTGCAVPQFVATVHAAWITSDKKDVTISNAADDTNGTATCLNATDGPVTVTATAPTGSLDYTPKTATAMMTCK